MWEYRNSSELYHHGIIGQRWGVRRFQKKDGSLTNAGKEREEKKGLSDKQKRAIKIGAAVVASALLAYGAYKLKKSGKLDVFIEKGKNVFNRKQLSGDIIKKLGKQETLSQSIVNANPLKGSIEGANNCVPSAISGFMRQSGFNVVAKSTGGKAQNTAGVIEECFKGVNRDHRLLEGSAVKFGKSKQDAAEMLVSKYGKNAEGICAIDWKQGGGHCFSWRIKDGITSFFDCQQGRDNIDKYFNLINRNGQLTIARLDGLDIDLNAVSKYVKTE